MQRARLPLGVLLLALLCTRAPAASAQLLDDEGPARPLWLNLGLGSEHTRELISAMAGLSRTLESGRIATLRVSYMEEMLFCFGPCSVSPEQRLDVAVLYGAALQGRRAMASAAAGFGILDGRRTIRRDRQLDSRSFTTGGATAEVQLYVRPLSFLGLGATGYLHLNPEVPFAGLNLGVQLVNRDPRRW